MARTQPHFEYHVREAVRSKRRFGVWTAALVMGLAVVVGLQFRGTHAAQALTVSGRVVNISNGAGIPNAEIKVCGAGIAVSNSGGYWSVPGIEPGQSYCVQYVGGAPKLFSGPYAVDNNPDVGQNPAYLNQVAGVDCFNVSKCSASEQKWDRGSDSGFDFAFINKSGALSSGSGIGIGSYVLAAAVTPPNVALAASAVNPTVPTNFQATVDTDNAVVTLTWTPSTAANGLKGYIIQRSLDDATWSTLSSNVTGDSYTDKTASFGINFFYQITSVDTVGNMSGWTGTEAQTPSFSNNSQTSSNSSSNTTFTSDDGLVSVTVPPGAITQDADCSVDTLKLTSSDTQPSNPGFKLVMGPYQFVCKQQSGQEVPPMAQAVQWVFQVNTRLGRLINPQVDDYGTSNGATTVVPGPYNTSAGTITVSETSPDAELIVMAAAPAPFVPTNFVIAVILLILIFVGLAMLILRQQQKISYHDYLRKKYTNL